MVRIARRLLPLLPLTIAIAGVGISLRYLIQRNSDGAAHALHVLSYSGFISSWGPGPELAKRFEARTGIKVEFRDGGDAGLLLKKLELFPSDLVIGIDSLGLESARAAVLWRAAPSDLSSDLKWKERDFVAFDWAPLAFIYRQGEIEPPTSLKDLRDERFRGSLVLMDPRTSTPGLQFLYWLFDDSGLSLDNVGPSLQALKANVTSVQSGWSEAYGMFTKNQAKLALSYLTSPVYHSLHEKDDRYRAAIFPEGHPVQIEYAGIPVDCRNCSAAESFLRFLVEAESQKTIMEKNVMLPVVASAAQGSAFGDIPEVKIRSIQAPGDLEKQKIFEIWKKVGL